MRITSILVCLLFVINLCFSQKEVKDKGRTSIGVTYSLGDNDVIRFKELAGAASYDSDKFFDLGMSYIYPINNRLSLETGFEYSKHSIIVNPPWNPNVVRASYKNDVSIINFPVTLRMHFLKYLFLNGGLLVDIDMSSKSAIDTQTGIGGLIGFGVNYDFQFGASIFINPYLKAYSLIPFSDENYPQKLMEAGVRVGMTYNLKRS